MNLTSTITNHYRSLFLLLSVALLVTGSLTQKDKNLVVTPASPNGMVSMELNSDTAQRTRMFEAWDTTYKNILVYEGKDVRAQKITGAEALDSENNADYLFIPCYVLLFLLFILRLGEEVNVPRNYTWQPGDNGTRITPFGNGRRRWLFVLGAMVIVAGLMDYLEDIGICQALNHHFKKETLPAITHVYYPATIKWLLISFVFVVLAYWAFKLKKVSLWLEEISVDIKKLLGLCWQFRMVLITLGIYFLALYVSDQGQDLLLTVNSAEGLGHFLFLLTITVIALLCWYLPKAIDNAQSSRQFWFGPVDFADKTKKPKLFRAKLDIARLMGAAGFLVPAGGILKTMQAYHVDYPLSGIPSLAVMAGLLILYTQALRHDWIDRFYAYGQRTKRYIITMVALVAVIIILAIVDTTSAHTGEPTHLLYLAIDLILLSVMFLITATLRVYLPILQNWEYAPWITFSSLICAIFFAACNWPEFLHHFIVDNRFYTLPIVFCAVAGYTLFFSYLMFIGKRTGIYITTMLLAITFYRSTTTINGYHMLAVETESCYKKHLDSLEKYAENWLIDREKEINNFQVKHHDKPYPVYFVNAHGGGIRAAIWTTMVIGELDAVIRAHAKTRYDSIGFQHYAFSYSGVSGGTVGLALLCGARSPHSNFPQTDETFYPANIKLYQTDNLTSDIVALLGRDAFMYSFGLEGVPDRNRLMEQDWEFNADRQKVNFSDRIGEIWKRGKTEIPLLFSNTYDIHTGQKGIVAPVLLDSMDFPATIFLEQGKEIPDPGDLRLSTAAFLSARFPYVSPTAKLHLHHFTDGGTFENSGSETSLQIIKVFERARANLIAKGHHELLKRISINIINLPNEIPALESPEQERNLYEPLGPPAGILALRSGNTARAQWINKQLTKAPYNYCYTVFQPKLTYGPGIWPVLPLGWQISDYALHAMQQSVQRNPSDLDDIYADFDFRR